MPHPLSTTRRALAAASLIAMSCGTHAADLTVTVENIQGNDGQIMVGLFDSAEAFPKQVKQGQRMAASGRDAQGSIRFLFAGITPGTYAVSAFHDRNGDGKLSTNVMNIPTEPYGFSGNASGAFGPPAFKDAALTLPPAGASITIQIK